MFPPTTEYGVTLRKSPARPGLLSSKPSGRDVVDANLPVSTIGSSERYDVNLWLPFLQRHRLHSLDDKKRNRRRLFWLSPINIKWNRFLKETTIRRPKGNLLVLAVSLISFAGSYIYIQLLLSSNASSRSLPSLSISISEQFPTTYHIVFSKPSVVTTGSDSSPYGPRFPTSKANSQNASRRNADYGGISYRPCNASDTTSGSSHSFGRTIPAHEYARAEAYREFVLEMMDGYLSKRYYSQEDLQDTDEKCRDPSWTSYKFPTCNTAHEMVIDRYNVEGDHWGPSHRHVQDYNVSYLSHGMYRDAWRFGRESVAKDDFVLKRLMTKKNFDQADAASIYREAIILERLSSSPRILGIYGHCGTSVMVESMASDVHTKIIPGEGLVSQAELDNLDNVYPNNTFTASEKLQISLSMAESLVDLHEFKEGGVIVHADTHIEQWLLAPDKTLKLNDFNNAKVMQWNSKAQEYCLAHSTYGGVWRAPEEYDGRSQDETKDTYSFANGIYTLLTGLWPFYDEEYREVDYDTIQDAIIAGKRPFVDERYRRRSFIEKMLIKVMEACWAPHREDRPSMSLVVNALQKIKMVAQENGELEPSNWIDIPMAFRQH